MRAATARAVLALAAACLGERRRDWALALEAELETAVEHGKPLSFALGCLAAALRDLPSHAEGRFAVASHLLAFLVLIPTAALLLSSLLGDFPPSFPGSAPGLAEGSAGGGGAPVHEGNRSAVPPLALLLAGLAGLHLRMAWLVLERDWRRVAATGALISAATATFLVFTLVVFADPAAIGLAAATALELAVISALARWHASALGGLPERGG
jgi:hypothetical protein